MTASILHQAVKNAGLKVVERHNHVTKVNYLPPGEDAAITWGVQDFRFKNTLKNPVRINVMFINDSLIFSHFLNQYCHLKSLLRNPCQNLNQWRLANQ
jgi:vancomycin resistance protein YoaR